MKIKWITSDGQHYSREFSDYGEYSSFRSDLLYSIKIGTVQQIWG